MKLAIAIAGVLATAKVYAQATACPDAAVFKQCLQNQDVYLNTCDYRCLCQWSKAKLSCYSSCPNDPDYGTQQNIVASYCSVPGANVTSTWTGSVAPTASPSSSANASATAGSKPSNDATQQTMALGWLLAGVITAVTFQT
ncbi:hypothetical protein DM01DRAFT_1219995 [Hesseltinella vesiculosa]|uniref:Extracellular membrane protein CFEM domain-containing protein n=1 Tax=Hesseltinella vesiculosa TaxID=101127 RepID=A0A1X2GQC6_9FUNG|nr:hypothetical protein DM01DRAFT_1219995 [Hesseltinella vesiculosa]